MLKQQAQEKLPLIVQDRVGYGGSGGYEAKGNYICIWAGGFIIARAMYLPAIAAILKPGWTVRAVGATA